MWGSIMQLPNIKILDEKEKILHKKALPVDKFPISKEDQKNIEDMITYGFYKNTKSELHENIVSAKNKLKKEVTDGEKF